MLKTITHSVSTVDSPKANRRSAVDNGPLAAAYASDGSKVNVFCINRKVPGYPEASDDGYTPFSLKLPFSQASRITVYKMTGKYTDTNIFEPTVTMTGEVLSTRALRDDGTFTIDRSTAAPQKDSAQAKRISTSSKARTCPRAHSCPSPRRSPRLLASSPNWSETASFSISLKRLD